MPELRSRKPKRRTVFKFLSISFLVLVVVVAGLGLYVYKQSVGHFQLRRLSLPTRVYADFVPLRPGVPLQPADLLEKLDRLGYRESESIRQPGDYKRDGTAIELYTRAFRHPSAEYGAQQIRVEIKSSAIESVVSLIRKHPIDDAALEPELLTSILSDQLENRRPVRLDQVPQHLKDAVVVTEDVRYWHHPGVDPLGILRAFFRNVRAKGVAEGGSTLTQQLVKNYYLTSEQTVKRKVVEAFMALILDAKYSKEEILEAYLNDIYLGRNRSISIVGVGEASRFYFGKPVSDITMAEAALLAGMIRSPNNNSPFANPERAMTRRNTVLGALLKNKKIDQATYETARAALLPRKPFQDKTGLNSIPYYVDRVLQEMEQDYGIEDVKGRGLQIYTAIDLSAQDTATRTLQAHLAELEKSSPLLREHETPLQGAVIHVDVPTGEIRALLGGRNYERSQFNRALHSKRLVGSLFKPYVFLTAFEPSLSNQNITQATLVSDRQFTLKRRFADDWTPRNYENHYRGTVSVRTALEHSLNAAAVRIGLACGIPAVIKGAKTLGISQDLADNPAILLGAVGIPPIEMADSYATIARMGARVPLRTIRFVTNDRGRVLSSASGVQAVQVFPARDVFVLVDVMKGVVDRGTAARARALGFKNIAAGKTGTTNDKRDAWFIGFTPQTLALTWVGFDDNAPTGLSGSDAAVPMWARYMNAVTAGHPNADFAVPGGISFAQFDTTSGGLASELCPRSVVVNGAFKSGTEPGQLCPLHSPQPAPMPMTDMFGNPIALDTAFGTTTDYEYVPPPAPPVPVFPQPEPALGGGTFRTDTAQQPVPDPASTPQPEPQPPPDPSSSAPQPSTNTSAPPTNTQ